MAPDGGWQLAECLLPGITSAAAAALAERIVAELDGDAREHVSFLGAILMPDDEVLLCLFAGPPPLVRSVAERSGLPFERIVPCAGIGWPAAGGSQDLRGG